ncbi:MAG TPA: type II toxin-antitoxin system HicA family toxin [Alphaproteobacteria bacterium]|nr:type II toxin-antitoxin system HicA family toxin [Alphaproteobacteria bacterium]
MPDNSAPRVKAMLRERRCVFVRHGKGDHDIRRSPINGRRFMVDNNIKSRHWANHTLKQADLEKAF